MAHSRRNSKYSSLYLTFVPTLFLAGAAFAHWGAYFHGVMLGGRGRPDRTVEVGNVVNLVGFVLSTSLIVAFTVAIAAVTIRDRKERGESKTADRLLFIYIGVALVVIVALVTFAP